MPYPRITFRFPRIIEGILKSRWISLGYRNVGAYIRGLVLQDIIREYPHDIGLIIEEYSLAGRDRFHAKLTTPEGLAQMRSWTF